MWQKSDIFLKLGLNLTLLIEVDNNFHLFPPNNCHTGQMIPDSSCVPFSGVVKP